MKHSRLFAVLLALALILAGCNRETAEYADAVEILLSGGAVQVDGKAADNDPQKAVYVANDIVYYESGKDFTYGEGTDEDAHSPEAAAGHTVVHITQPGTYRISGRLPLGQIAVDLGEDAEDDPAAVVTLILDGVDITCQVAPAVIFYNVYECGDKDNPSKDVDTSGTGANVIIADGSENQINGAYVARIYKPDSVELSEDGTAVEDAKKLHKYDGAFYSKMSMNIDGGKAGTGVLNIFATNEGLDSEMHLTINGGNIRISSGNDGINTNEDGVSVTTINGGNLTITVTGETGEGDGIDSNGWLVINGGTVTASACANSVDAGIDSDMGIHINGGTVIAGGHMLDRIEDGGQTYAVFHFARGFDGSQMLRLKDEDGNTAAEMELVNAGSVLVYSSADLKEGSYTFWTEDTQLAGWSSGMMGGMGMPGGMPGGMTPPEGEMPQGGQRPPEGEMPQGGQRPPEGEMQEDWMNRPNGGGQRPGGGFGGNWNEGAGQILSPEFKIVKGGNQFAGIMPIE